MVKEPKIQLDFSKQEIKLIFDNWTLTAWRNNQNGLIYYQSQKKGEIANPPKSWGNNFRTCLYGVFTENERLQRFIEKAIVEFDFLLEL